MLEKIVKLLREKRLELQPHYKYKIETEFSIDDEEFSYLSCYYWVPNKDYHTLVYYEFDSLKELEEFLNE